jgi:hypothetical protein
MSIINQTYPLASLAQVKGKVAQPQQPSPEQANTNATLVLEWFWLFTPAAEAGQKEQQLAARWRLKTPSPRR